MIGLIERKGRVVSMILIFRYERHRCGSVVNRSKTTSRDMVSVVVKRLQTHLNDRDEGTLNK